MPGPVAAFSSRPDLRDQQRGQAEGTFRAGVPFELAYATAVSCLVAVTVFAPRFAGMAETGLAANPARFRDQVVSQLLNGMTG